VVSAAVDGIGVACGDGVLMIHELQRAGGRRLRAREFLAGTPLPVGTRWQTPTAAAPR
jgi:methionyl-tRNA formyltransferase